MKTTTTKRVVMLFFALIFIATMGFTQNNEKKELAIKASNSLTEFMATALDLSSTQLDSVAQCNQSYTLVLFTTEPLTNEAIATFEQTLDTCLKEILDDTQLQLWTKNRKDWLNSVKNKLPSQEKVSPEELEDVNIL